MNDFERSERLKEILETLYDVNKLVPVIVEGKRDLQALRRIGLVGEIIPFHSGKGIYDFCEDLAESYHRVVLLMDWDEKGESLQRAISSHLQGMWEEFGPIRELLKILCQKDIREIEGIPKLLERLAGEEVRISPEEDSD